MTRFPFLIAAATLALAGCNGQQAAMMGGSQATDAAMIQAAAALLAGGQNTNANAGQNNLMTQAAGALLGGGQNTGTAANAGQNDMISQVANALLGGGQQAASNVQVNNIARMLYEQRNADGQTWVYMDFATQDGRLFRTRMPAASLNQQTLNQLQTLKGATSVFL